MNVYCAKYSCSLTILLGVLCSTIFAQDSTTNHSLPEFEVTEKIEVMFSEINTQRLDSSIIENNTTSNIANVLSKNSAVSIRAYGVSGISSVSMRGGNANHTAVMWNGFNIQDPLNGGFNFSQSSINTIDNIKIQYGGGSTAFGSGAIGGVIHLDNNPIFNKSFYGSVLAKTGSFGLNAYHIDLGTSGENVSTRIRLFSSSIDNNFEFQNIGKFGKPTERYLNAGITQFGLIHEIYYRLNSSQLISSQLWYQHNYRDIPANMTVSFQEGVEENITDDWIRWALNWKKKGEKINYEARTGVFNNKSEYINSNLGLASNNNSLRNSSEILAIANILKRQKVTIGLNNNYTIGLSDNFNGKPSLNTLAIYLAPSFIIGKKINLNTSIRQEHYNAEFKPFTYALNGKYLFYKSLYLSASFSKNYRTPNFNDLYWGGGYATGNPDLKDEHGYSKDIGLGYKKQNNTISIKSEVSFYLNSITNQIQWIAEGQNWIPRNVKEVSTKGLEYKLNSNYKVSNNSTIIVNLNYAYTDAQVKEKAVNESDEVLGKQLVYIPYYQANSYLGFKYKKTLFDVSVQYVGYQFTRADNQEWLDAYWLTDLGAKYVFSKKKFDIALFGKINNVFNAVYTVRQWYPMPQLNYEIGINLTLK